ncbi:hypothetical protein MMC10_000843 [Thelotrema lepadinum]|nr:hypothetical protein [Thelotrema lepadinum]
MIPFSRDPNFIGREEILDEIHREHRQKTNQNHARSALVGLGGVGCVSFAFPICLMKGLTSSSKSQIAIEYAYRVRELTPDCSVFWVHGSNTNRFEQGYTNIASKLQLPGRDDPKIDVLCLVYDWLCDESNGRWLMIIDNADDENTFFRVEEEPEDTTGAGSAKSNKAPLEAFLPQTANGSILITTRNSKVAMSLSGATGSLVRVEPMSEKDAFELLKTKNSDALSDEPFGVDAIALVQALDCIPLAIVQAGAYISSRLPRITLTRYLELFRESEASQRQLLSTVALQDIRRDYSTRHSVTTTFTLSFRQIQQYFPEATDLLALMAMFDRQGIPEDLLHDRKNQLRFEDAVAPLLGYSLITAGLVQPSFTMHRLVQLSMTHWLEKNKQLARWRQRSIEALSNAFPDQEVPPWSKSQALLPHSEKVITDSDEDSNDPNLWTLTENHGWYLFQVGHYRAAESMLRKILKRNEKSLGLGHELCQENVMKLALVLESQGSYQAMEPLLRQSLAANETNSKPSALWSLRQGDQLSKVLRRLGRPKEADILDRKLVSIATEFLPRGFQATLSGSGSLPNSNECQEGKIPLHDLILPESTPIISLMILGQMFERLGQLDPAVQLYKIILAADEKSVGPEHPRTLSTMEVVASVLRRKSAFKEAEDLYRRILTTIEKTMPSNHPDVLVTMYMLVFVLIKQDKFAEAEILLRRVATDINGTPTFEFDKRIWCVQELGNVLMKQNKYHEAEIVLQDGVALEVRELNHEQVNILQNVISLLVDSLKKQEKFEEANATVRRAIQGYQQRLDSLPSDTLSLLWGTLLRLQITVLCDCGRFQDVEGVLKGAHQFLETLRPNHPAEPDFACIFSSLMG